MIIGIGTDIAAIERFEKNLNEHGSRFTGKILAPDELPHFEATKLQAQFLASRFAAKEAVVKALGTGFRDGIIMPDIAILNNELGRPYVKLSGEVLIKAQSLGVKDIHLSISHEKTFALAFIVIES